MFERFTTGSREVVRRAVEEAERRDSPVIGPEHLLLALLHAERPAAALAAHGVDPAAAEEILAELGRNARRGGLDREDTEALAAFGIDVDAIVAGIEQEHGEGALVPPVRRGPAARLLGRAGAAVRHRPFTPAAKQVLERTLREALADEAKELTVEHVLLGLVSGDDPVARAVTARGAGTTQLRTWFATHPV